MASYEENKALYGAARARQMEREQAMAPAVTPGMQPLTPAAPAAPTAWGGSYSTPQDLGAFQTWYGQQQGGNRPEDMARFLWTGNAEGVGNMSGDTLARWNPYLVTSGAGAGKYRSMRGAEGLFDKPTECPPGMYPSGPNETDPCVGGGQTAPKQPTEAAVAPQQGPSLQDIMAQIQAGMGQVQASPVSAPQRMTPQQPLQSSLQGLMGGLQSKAGNTGIAGPLAQNPGWSSTAGGLKNMLLPYQKKNPVGSWF